MKKIAADRNYRMFKRAQAMGGLEQADWSNSLKYLGEWTALPKWPQADMNMVMRHIDYQIKKLPDYKKVISDAIAKQKNQGNGSE